MAMEPSSSISNNTTTPSSSSSAESYMGSFLSVTSKSEIRYEGVLYHLNPQDSTIGLKNVRSYGTEGRKTSGPQVPPGDKLYQYIMFRGSDIKDLQVKNAALTQTEEPIQDDPAIIKMQKNYYGEPPTSSASTLTDLRVYGEPSAISYPNLVPPNFSGTHLGMFGSPHTTHSVMSYNGMPPQWQEYSGGQGSIISAQQHSLSSAMNLYPLQNEASATNAVSNITSHVSPAHMIATSSSAYMNTTPYPTSEQLSVPPTASVSSLLSPFHNSTLVNSNGLAMPFPLTYQPTNSVEAVDKLVPSAVSLFAAQSSPYSSSLISDPTPELLILQPPTFLTSNQFSQPRLSEYSSSKSLYSDQIDISINMSSTATNPAVQPPLLPLPPSSQKLHYSSQFTEEFDFQAMNEKFNKDEVWGNLGIGVRENATSRQDAGVINRSLLSKSEPKPAYNKDDFFDTISCNSVGRGARNGHDQSSERIKVNSETFGNFQQRRPFGYDGYGARQGDYRGQFHRGRGHGYNYHNTGRGDYMQR